MKKKIESLDPYIYLNKKATQMARTQQMTEGATNENFCYDATTADLRETLLGKKTIEAKKMQGDLCDTAKSGE